MHPSHAVGSEFSHRKAYYLGLSPKPFSPAPSESLTHVPQRGTPHIHSSKKCCYFDPDAIRIRTLDIPVASSPLTVTEYAVLERLEPFRQGRELVRGCKVGITRNNRRHFYMVYTKYRRGQINYAILEEYGGVESWRGPLVVMRLDALSATRLVSISTKAHKEAAIMAVAKWVFSVVIDTILITGHCCTRFIDTMNTRISTSPRGRVQWAQML